MDKMMWSKPEMNEFVFVANAYCSGCTDTYNSYWKFVCNVGGGFLNNLFDIYEGEYDSNKTARQNATESINLTPGNAYIKCGETHYVKQGDDVEFYDVFKKGWADSNSLDPNDIFDNTNYAGDVYIWKGVNGNEVHATWAVDNVIQTVEGNKS